MKAITNPHLTKLKVSWGTKPNKWQGCLSWVQVKSLGNGCGIVINLLLIIKELASYIYIYIYKDPNTRRKGKVEERAKAVVIEELHGSLLGSYLLIKSLL
jgi:hypothetical protein